MAVFSLADRASFEKLPQWLSDAKAQARPDITILIVGNKSDLAGEQRQVTMIEASRLAQAEGCAYIETSARSGENVEAAYFKLTRSVLTRLHDGHIDGAALSARGHGGAGAAGVARKDTAAAGTADAAAGGCSC